MNTRFHAWFSRLHYLEMINVLSSKILLPQSVWEGGTKSQSFLRTSQASLCVEDCLFSFDIFITYKCQLLPNVCFCSDELGSRFRFRLRTWACGGSLPRKAWLERFVSVRRPGKHRPREVICSRSLGAALGFLTLDFLLQFSDS